MSYNAVPTSVTGDFWTAANQNTYVRDNFKAAVGDWFTAAGQIPYGTAENLGGLLPIGDYFQTLKVDADGNYPEWQTRNNQGILLQYGQWTSLTEDWCRVFFLANSEIYNRGGFVYTSSDNDVTIPFDGIYEISGIITFSLGLYVGPVQVRIGPDDTVVIGGNTTTTGQSSWPFCEVKHLSQNDKVYIDIYNPTIASAFGDSTQYYTRLSIRYLGAST